MQKHQLKEQTNTVGSFVLKVTGTARDYLTRQAREAVHIRRCQVPTLNSKTEWHQLAPFTVQNKVYRGYTGHCSKCVVSLDYGVEKSSKI
jgi:hypothetical protein